MKDSINRTDEEWERVMDGWEKQLLTDKNWKREHVDVQLADMWERRGPEAKRRYEEKKKRESGDTVAEEAGADAAVETGVAPMDAVGETLAAKRPHRVGGLTIQEAHRESAKETGSYSEEDNKKAKRIAEEKREADAEATRRVEEKREAAEQRRKAAAENRKASAAVSREKELRAFLSDENEGEEEDAPCSKCEEATTGDELQACVSCRELFCVRCRQGGIGGKVSFLCPRKHYLLQYQFCLSEKALPAAMPVCGWLVCVCQNNYFPSPVCAFSSALFFSVELYHMLAVCPR